MAEGDTLSAKFRTRTAVMTAVRAQAAMALTRATIRMLISLIKGSTSRVCSFVNVLATDWA